MGQSIIVFAGKEVGSALLRYLVDIGAPLRRVIAESHDDAEIVSIARSNNIRCDVFNGSMVSSLLTDRTVYDWMLNLWSGHILDDNLLRIAKRRLNVHPGLVPQCRGRDCATWVIRDRLPAGASLLEMTEKVDRGDVYAQQPVPYSFPTQAKELQASLKLACIDLFKENWPSIFDGRIVPQPQEPGGAVYKRRQTIEDRCMDAEHNATLGDLVDWALAHDFGPDTTAEFVRDGKRFAISVGATLLEDSE